WSLDHLFLDEEGVPMLVEVKRSTDTRIRREVVGQMLDYAANALSYWNVAAIKARFEAEQLELENSSRSRPRLHDYCSEFTLELTVFDSLKADEKLLVEYGGNPTQRR